MTERDDLELTGDPLSPAKLAALSHLLADRAVWEHPDPRLEDAVVAAIVAEAAAAPPVPRDDITVLSDRRPVRSRRSSRTGSRRRVANGWGLVVGAAVAAALIIVVVVTAAVRRPVDVPESQFALTARADAPAGATADAVVRDKPDGTQIVLTMSGLPPAPENEYYELWMLEDDPGSEPVSAGTFHMRGGGGQPIEMWAGVTKDEYPNMTVTLEHEDDGPGSSNRIVFSGRIP